MPGFGITTDDISLLLKKVKLLKARKNRLLSENRKLRKRVRELEKLVLPDHRDKYDGCKTEGGVGV